MQGYEKVWRRRTTNEGMQTMDLYYHCAKQPRLYYQYTPPSISETITRLKSLADKYSKHDIKRLYSHSPPIPTLTYILTIGSGCRIQQSNEILTRDEILQVGYVTFMILVHLNTYKNFVRESEVVDSYYRLVLHCQQNLYPQHHENH